eukprot:653503_1
MIYSLFHCNKYAIYIYIAPKQHIAIGNIRRYLHNFTLIPVANECTMNSSNKYESCIRRKPRRKIIPSTGDFTLLHNNSLYAFYGGAYVETCMNLHLDSEFVVRKW